MINVLYLDDESHNLTAFRAAFRRDFQVHVTTEPTEAVRILREQPIEVIISDQKMPSLSGVEFFELIMPDFPDPIRMLLTGHADIDAVIDAINKGQIYKYISKPWNEAELKALVTEKQWPRKVSNCFQKWTKHACWLDGFKRFQTADIRWLRTLHKKCPIWRIESTDCCKREFT